MDMNFKNELSHITFSIFLRLQKFSKIDNLAENMELKVKFSNKTLPFIVIELQHLGY